MTNSGTSYSRKKAERGPIVTISGAGPDVNGWRLPFDRRPKGTRTRYYAGGVDARSGPIAGRTALDGAASIDRERTSLRNLGRAGGGKIHLDRGPRRTHHPKWPHARGACGRSHIKPFRRLDPGRQDPHGGACAQSRGLHPAHARGPGAWRRRAPHARGDASRRGRRFRRGGVETVGVGQSEIAVAKWLICSSFWSVLGAATTCRASSAGRWNGGYGCDHQGGRRSRRSGGEGAGQFSRRSEALPTRPRAI